MHKFMGMCFAVGLHFLKKPYEQDCFGNVSFSDVDWWGGGRGDWTGSVQTLKFSVLLGSKMRFPDFGLFVPQWMTLLYLSILCCWAGYKATFCRRLCCISDVPLPSCSLDAQKSVPIGTGTSSYCRVRYSLWHVLTSHKKLKVHLQYVKSWSLYQEVASGTADKVFWL